MNRNAGYILLTVLVFLQICSMASLAGLLHTAKVLRQNNHLWQNQLLSLQAHTILQHLENQIESKLHCMINTTPAVKLANHTVEWWKANACSDEAAEFHYYYVIETLGVDPCAIIDSRIAAYYRITLFILSDKLRYLLQSTIALPAKAIHSCEKNSHHVAQGRQMWRETNINVQS